jgi:hypothetical protein
MRAKQCEELLGKAIRRSLIRRTDGDVTDDILMAMNECYARKDWSALCSLTWVAQCYPDRKFTPLFCALLDDPHDVYMEAIADAFWDIADERAVASIIGALDYYVAGDDDRHFSRKLIHALAKINTTEAVEGLHIASHNTDEMIRREARRELDKLRQERS